MLNSKEKIVQQKFVILKKKINNDFYNKCFKEIVQVEYSFFINVEDLTNVIATLSESCFEGELSYYDLTLGDYSKLTIVMRYNNQKITAEKLFSRITKDFIFADTFLKDYIQKGQPTRLDISICFNVKSLESKLDRICSLLYDNCFYSDYRNNLLLSYADIYFNYTMKLINNSIRFNMYTGNVKQIGMLAAMNKITTSVARYKTNIIEKIEG